MSWLNCASLDWYYDAIAIPRPVPRTRVFNSLSEMFAELDEELYAMEDWQRRN